MASKTWRDVREPFRRRGQNGTEFVIPSSVSWAWPIPDAGLGATSEMFEVLMSAMGSLVLTVLGERLEVSLVDIYRGAVLPNMLLVALSRAVVQTGRAAPSYMNLNAWFGLNSPS